MSTAPDDQEFRKRMERLERLLQDMEQLPDAATRSRVREIVQTILDLHSTGLERILNRLADAGETGMKLIDSLSHDDVIGSLLLLYGLHPLDLETRVRQALERVAPLLRSQGGRAELLTLIGTVAQVQLVTSSNVQSTSSLKSAIEEAIYARAPDITAIEVELGATDDNIENTGHSRITLPLVHG